MNPFHMFLALGPVSVYLLALSGIHFGRHPVVITGTRDALALGLACAGFVLVGPLQLFAPNDGVVAMWLGGWIWVPLLGLYALCVQLASLLIRPRLIVYNTSYEKLRPHLELVTSELDENRCWAGSSVMMAKQGVQMTVEAWPTMHIVQLVSAGPHQDLMGWKRLERGLRARLQQVPAGPNPRAASYLFFALLLISIVIITGLQQPQQIAEGIDRLLER